MKNLLIKLSIVTVVLLNLTSCEKDSIYPSDDYPKGNPESYYLWENDKTQSISLFGKFKVIDAVMYVDNTETGEKIKYNHFGYNKTNSSLLYGGYKFDIEIIVKGETTYSFYRNGDFILNGDMSKRYYISSGKITEHPLSTTQLLGGSSRPFSGQILDYNNKLVSMQIQEMYGSIDGANCRYWTQLTLQKIEEW
jgi:hypothetical protein